MNVEIANEIENLRKKIAGINKAIDRAIENGGVTSYGLNSGQTQSNVRQASLAELENIKRIYERDLNELITPTVYGIRDF